jgi:hypothetical protein
MREFHGVCFDVNITIDKDYILGGGLFTKSNQIGFGYQDEGSNCENSKVKTLTWHLLLLWYTILLGQRIKLFTMLLQDQ